MKSNKWYKLRLIGLIFVLLISTYLPWLPPLTKTAQAVMPPTSTVGLSEELTVSPAIKGNTKWFYEALTTIVDTKTNETLGKVYRYKSNDGKNTAHMTSGTDAGKWAKLLTEDANYVYAEFIKKATKHTMTPPSNLGKSAFERYDFTALLDAAGYNYRLTNDTIYITEEDAPKIGTFSIKESPTLNGCYALYSEVTVQFTVSEFMSKHDSLKKIQVYGQYEGQTDGFKVGEVENVTTKGGVYSGSFKYKIGSSEKLTLYIRAYDAANRIDQVSKQKSLATFEKFGTSTTLCSALAVEQDQQPMPMYDYSNATLYNANTLLNSGSLGRQNGKMRNYPNGNIAWYGPIRYPTIYYGKSEDGGTVTKDNTKFKVEGSGGGKKDVTAYSKGYLYVLGPVDPKIAKPDSKIHGSVATNTYNIQSTSSIGPTDVQKMFNGNAEYVLRETPKHTFTSLTGKELGKYYWVRDLAEYAGGDVSNRCTTTNDTCLEIYQTAYPDIEKFALKSTNQYTTAGKDIVFEFSGYEYVSNTRLGKVRNKVNWEIEIVNGPSQIGEKVKGTITSDKNSNNAKLPAMKAYDGKYTNTTAKIQPKTNGDYVVRLTITDEVQRSVQSELIAFRIGSGGGSIPVPPGGGKPPASVVPPIPPAPPTVQIVGPNKVAIGDEFCLEADAQPADSKDKIVSYTWFGFTGTGSLKGQNTCNLSFSSPGEFKITVYVEDNNGLGATAEHTIEVTPPIPDASFSVGGSLKENRKMTLRTSHPYAWNEKMLALAPLVTQKWTIAALDAANANKIRTVENISQNLSYEKVVNWLVKAPGKYKITRYVKNSLGYESEVTMEITVAPDAKPDVDISMPTIYYRDGERKNAAGNPLAEIRVNNYTYSLDNDDLQKYIYTIYIDDANDGKFSSTPIVIDSSVVTKNKAYEYTHPAGNAQNKIAFTLDDGYNLTILTPYVGKYKIELEAWEIYGEETISQFVDLSFNKSSTDVRYNDTASKNVASKTVEVDNLKPITSLKVNEEQIAELQFDITDSPFNKAQLQSSEAYLKNLLSKEGIKLNAKYIERKDIDKVAFGLDHAVILADGTAYTVGGNSNGQLAGGPLADSPDKLVKVNLNERVKDVFASDNSTFFITEDNKVYAAGEIMYKQVNSTNTGQFVTSNALFPEVVEGLPNNVIKVVTTRKMSIITAFLTSDGRIYAGGYAGHSHYHYLGEESWQSNVTRNLMELKNHKNVIDISRVDAESFASAFQITYQGEEIKKNYMEHGRNAYPIYFGISGRPDPYYKFIVGGSEDITFLGEKHPIKKMVGTDNFGAKGTFLLTESGRLGTFFVTKWSLTGILDNIRTLGQTSGGFEVDINGRKIEDFNYMQKINKIYVLTTDNQLIQFTHKKELLLNEQLDAKPFESSENVLFTSKIAQNAVNSNDLTYNLSNVDSHFFGVGNSTNKTVLEDMVSKNNLGGKYINLTSTNTSEINKMYDEMAKYIISVMGKKTVDVQFNLENSPYTAQQINAQIPYLNEVLKDYELISRVSFTTKYTNSQNPLYMAYLSNKASDKTQMNGKLQGIEGYFVGGTTSTNNTVLTSVLADNRNKGIILPLGTSYTDANLKTFIKNLADYIILTQSDNSVEIEILYDTASWSKATVDAQIPHLVNYISGTMSDTGNSSGNYTTNEVLVRTRAKQFTDSFKFGDVRLDGKNKFILVLANKSITGTLEQHLVGTALANEAYLIGINTDINRLVSKNMKKGTFITSTGTQPADFMKKVGAYVLDVVNENRGKTELYLPVNKPVSYSSNYSDYENDPQYDFYWKFTHDLGYFESETSRIIQNGVRLKTPIEQFGLTGRYLPIYSVQDDPLSKVFSRRTGEFLNYRKWSDEDDSLKMYVHYLPDSSFKYTVNTVNRTYTVTSTAQDIDKASINVGFGNGLQSQKFSWRLKGDFAWTDGLPPSPLNGKSVYEVRNTVVDFQGVTDHTVNELFVGNLPPVGEFTTNKAVYVQNEQIQITNNSFDPNGDNMTSDWCYIKLDDLGNEVGNCTAFASGGTFTSNKGNTNWSPKFTIATAGMYKIKLKVADTFSAVGTAYAIVAINPSNNPPIAEFTTNKKEYKLGENIVITNTSRDVDGDNLTGTWCYQKSGSSTCTPFAPNASFTSGKGNTNWSPTIPSGTIKELGEYIIKLEVSDGKEKVSTQQTIKIMNTPPIASFSTNKKQYKLTESVVITNTSTDADGDNLKATWCYQKLGSSTCTTFAPNAEFTNGKGNANWSPTIPVGTLKELGDYIIKLTVTDNVETSTTQQTISMVNSPPVASFTTNKKEYKATESIVITNTSTDADGDNLKATWCYQKVGSSTCTTFAPNAEFTNGKGNANWSPTIPAGTLKERGDYVIKLSVTDNIATATAQQTIKIINSPPVASFTTNKKEYKVTENIVITNTSKDADGDNLKATWCYQKVGSSTCTAFASNAEFTNGKGNANWSPTIPAGTLKERTDYVIKLTVTDSIASSSTEQTIKIINSPPVASFTTNKKEYRVTENIVITNTSTDADGDNLKATWCYQKVGSSTCTAFASNAEFTNGKGNANWSPTIPAGTLKERTDYVIKLTVTDNIATSTAQQTIKIINSPPVASFTTDKKEYEVIHSIVITNKTTDADGDNMKATWCYQKVGSSTCTPFAPNAEFTNGKGNTNWNPTIPPRTLNERGEYIIKLEVTDGIDKSTAQQTIKIINSVPVACMKILQGTYYIGDDIVIENCSTDANLDDTLTYSWIVQRGSDTGTVYRTGSPEVDARGNLKLKANRHPQDLGRWNIVLLVHDGHIPEAVQVVGSLIVVDQTVQGQVAHTDQWLKNIQKYNAKYPSKKLNLSEGAGLMEFVIGEKFMLNATGDGNQSTSRASLKVKILEYPTVYNATLAKRSGAGNLWNGSIWKEDMFIRFKNKDVLKFEFEAVFDNGWIAKDVVSIRVRNEDYWKQYTKY